MAGRSKSVFILYYDTDGGNRRYVGGIRRLGFTSRKADATRFEEAEAQAAMVRLNPKTNRLKVKRYYK